jgi:WD40 repeat protein
MLLWDEEHVRAWDLFDETWSATISNGSGGMGKIVNAEFGRTEDEVLIFSDFGSKVTVWLLQTRRTIEIRHPKFASAKGFGYRSNGGVFALLSRPGAQDVLTLHTPGAYALMTTTMLPTTDAQGLKWSVDGRWIAVWDTPSIGYKIYIYTADGYLYRTYSGDTAEALQGLGVKSLEWSPGGDCIAIGGHDRRVTLLSSRTFSPIMFLDHTVTIQLTEGHTVWEEQVSASSQRSYIAVSQPLTPPTASPATSDQTIKTGMSIMSFNSEGSRFATRDDTAPTTVWLWDLSKLAACAVLIQHSPVKHMSWHPTVSSLLLIQCSHDESIVYIYDTSKSAPYAIQLPLERSSGRLEAKWVHTSADKRPALTFGDCGNFLVVWPDGKDVIVRFEDDSHDESEDSLFEILTGRSPTKSKIDSTEVLVSDVLDETTEVMDDTFVGRGRWGVT